MRPREAILEEPLRSLTGHSARIGSMAFCPTGCSSRPSYGTRTPARNSHDWRLSILSGTTGRE
jgi:hypothetical protein